MLLSFSRGLSGMMTLDAADRTGSVDAIFSAVVIDVIKSHLPELHILTKNDYVRNGGGSLSVADDRKRVGSAYRQSDENKCCDDRE